MGKLLRRIFGFFRKHDGWRKSRDKEIEKFTIKYPFEIYKKYEEKKKEFLKIEREHFSPLYFDKTKVDKEYFELKGWVDCLKWVRSL